MLHLSDQIMSFLKFYLIKLPQKFVYNLYSYTNAVKTVFIFNLYWEILPEI